MILGAEITVMTDHKNLTHKLSSFTMQQVMRWRLLLEEFGPKFEYKKGSENCIANRTETESILRYILDLNFNLLNTPRKRYFRLNYAPRKRKLLAL